MSIYNSLLELFYPRLCVSCQKRLIVSENHICINCFLKLSEIKFNNENSIKLETFFAGRFPFTYISSFAPFVKGGIIQKIIHEIKYRNNPSLAIYIGRLCGYEIVKQGRNKCFDLLVPIPLHKKRMKKRGYNQSLLIAKGISEITNIPISSNILVRKINNSSQTKKHRFERWQDTEQIFDIIEETTFSNRHLLLIDDVITTGATIEACAKQILRCKNSQVSIYSIGAVN